MEKSITYFINFISKNFKQDCLKFRNAKNKKKMQDSKSGFILIELCLGALILAFIVVVSYTSFVKFIITNKNICNDLELFRVNRTISAFFRRELTSRVDYIILTDNDFGSVITCYDKVSNQEIKYYRSSATKNSLPAIYQLYLQRKVGDSMPGKNPLLPPSVDIKSFKVTKLNENSILIEMELLESTTKRAHKFLEVITSCNIKRIEEMKGE